MSAARRAARHGAFLTWYAFQDLFHRRSRATTLALVLSVAIATAAAILAMAIPDITAAIRLARLAKSPLARCIWLDDSRSAKFGDARIAKLRGRIDGIRNPTVAEYELFGFHDVVGLEFAALDAEGSYRSSYGRTLAPGDPIFGDLDRILESPALSEEGGGIIVSKPFLKKLGWMEGTPTPAALRVRFGATGIVSELPFGGVSRESLPLNHAFWITEGQDRKLRTAAGGKPDRVWSGPIPAGWPTVADDYEAKCGRLIDRFGTEVACISLDGVWHLEFRTTDKAGKPLKDWNDLMIGIRETMARERPDIDASRFLRTNYDPLPDPIPIPRGDYGFLAVYATELKDLKPIAAVSAEHADSVNDGSRLLVDEIESTAARTRRILFGLAFAFLASGIITLVLALNLRARHKIAQIGLLGMMGMGRRSLIGLMLIEAAILWILGTAAAILLVALFAALGYVFTDITPAEVRAAASAGSWASDSALFACGYLGVCLVGNFLATRPAWRSPPVTAMTQTF